MLEPSRPFLWTTAILGVINTVEHVVGDKSKLAHYGMSNYSQPTLQMKDAHGIRNILPRPSRQQVHAVASCNAGFVNKPMSKR
jgi:hypothetical protein